MRYIRLIEEPTTQVGLNEAQAEADRVDYVACIQQVIRAPMNPAAGVQLDEMEKGIRVLNALRGRKVGDILPLEDADWQHLCEKVRSTRWQVVDERLVRFSHTILEATERIPDDVPGFTHSQPAGSDISPGGPQPPAPGMGSNSGVLHPGPDPGPPA